METHNYITNETMREALNSASDEKVFADPIVFLMGEKIGRYDRFYF